MSHNSSSIFIQFKLRQMYKQRNEQQQQHHHHHLASISQDAAQRENGESEKDQLSMLLKHFKESNLTKLDALLKSKHLNRKRSQAAGCIPLTSRIWKDLIK